jgi:hypothetical protein
MTRDTSVTLKRLAFVAASVLLLAIALDASRVARPGPSISTPSPAAARAARARDDVPASGVFAMRPSPSSATQPVRAQPPRPAEPREPQAPALPFSYLGKITEDGATTILLSADGRTFKVRGTGRLDDHYQVDAIADDHLVIRYLPLGTTQVLELALRRYVPPAGSPEQYPQD